ncbi:tellurite resistance/C4-dicarboxylate transporter family protein [Nitrosovibrio tenuis]|uniref:Tellurite resistance protein TehA n=1 Tax=Nitrosovibrio tenuis TaxID=1233 RepID=A0A1H7ME60_9PROT|nr:tellurite resistance/C4-dicarboxylate transporter family protein [Nitrosovibrio tenuis]SEL09610.1 Tellurite resistance protein TehA [Nitrosovibrio tenuis]
MKQCGAVIASGIRDFHPVYFAMVMATGIVSIALEAMAFPGIAKVLFTLNAVFYVLFCIMLIARALLFSANLLADLRTLPRSWLFLTFVVGTNTVGMQLVIFLQAGALAGLLWLIALMGWLICMCFIIFNLVGMSEKSIRDSLNGTTLLIVVSTVSVALLGVRLLDPADAHADYGYFAIWSFWAAGFILYLFIAARIIYRLFFSRFKQDDWDAPYWICMGAPAILTLTGSELTMYMPAIPLWDSMRAITLWMTFFAWVLGTFWIPYLLVMDILKFTHVPGPAPLWIKIFPWSRLAFGRQYHFFNPPSWSRVFPMGMYTACTLSLAKASGYGFLEVISGYWGWFALLIWSLTLIGTLRSLIPARPCRVDDARQG